MCLRPIGTALEEFLRHTELLVAVAAGNGLCWANATLGVGDAGWANGRRKLNSILRTNI